MNFISSLPICLLNQDHIPGQGSNSPQSVPTLHFKLCFPLLPLHPLCSEHFPSMFPGAESRSVLLTVSLYRHHCLAYCRCSKWILMEQTKETALSFPASGALLTLKFPSPFSPFGNQSCLETFFCPLPREKSPRFSSKLQANLISNLVRGSTHSIIKAQKFIRCQWNG